MRPINSINDKCARVTKQITFNPISQAGIERMTEWLMSETWESVTQSESAHDKASKFQSLLLRKFNNFSPQGQEKSAVMTSLGLPSNLRNWIGNVKGFIIEKESQTNGLI